MKVVLRGEVALVDGKVLVAPGYGQVRGAADGKKWHWTIARQSLAMAISLTTEVGHKCRY